MPTSECPWSTIKETGRGRAIHLLYSFFPPPDVLDVFERGLNCAEEPKRRRAQVLPLSRATAQGTLVDEEQGCIQVAVTFFDNTVSFRMVKSHCNKVVCYVDDHHFMLLLSDKEGGLVVPTEGVYATRAKAAINKNLYCVGCDFTETKGDTLKLFEDSGLHKTVMHL